MIIQNKNVSLIISPRMNIVCLTEDCLNMIKDVDVFIALKFLYTKELEWVDFDLTALCPYCGIDAVIGESAGYPLTEELLKKMRDYWFSC